MTPSSRWSALLAAGGAIVATAASAASAQTPLPSPADARLQGTFELLGRVTVARYVRGEHVGEIVQRQWTFTPQCPAGPCDAVSVTRTRAAGTDTLVLRRRAPGVYAGAGRFFAPLRCAGHVNPTGQEVPFRITVHVTAAAESAGVVVATRVRASYTNSARINRTRCVAVLGHDAARYHGHLVTG